VNETGLSPAAVIAQVMQRRPTAPAIPSPVAVGAGGGMKAEGR